MGKNENFFKFWSSEMAYVLGFFAADGYMIKNKHGGYYVDFYSNDKGVLEKILGAVQGDQKITVRRTGVLGSTLSYRLQFGSKIWFEDLTRLGFMQRKSKVLRFPAVPEVYLRDFVRGYFDGDGSVNLGRYWRKDRGQWKWEFTTRFTSGSPQFLQGLWMALKSAVQGGYFYQKYRACELVFARHDSVALFRFMYHNVSPEMYLTRKYDVFRKAFEILQLRA